MTKNDFYQQYPNANQLNISEYAFVIDECVPTTLYGLFDMDKCFFIRFSEYEAIKNGELLRLIGRRILLTIDNAMKGEQISAIQDIETTVVILNAKNSAVAVKPFVELFVKVYPEFEDELKESTFYEFNLNSLYECYISKVDEKTGRISVSRKLVKEF
jgi:hypothetical protein